jgi:hypothetical protein
MMIDLIHIEPAGPRALELTFADRAHGRWAADAVLARDTVLTRPLEDPSCFARAFIEAGALAWPTASSSPRTACTRTWRRRECWCAGRREPAPLS